jgi:hypothetical protein
VNFGLAPAEEAFRDEVRAFLVDWAHLDGFYLQGRHWGRVRQFFLALGERGWLSLGWPARAGGEARAPIYEYLLWDEVARARVARPPLSAGIVAKTLARYGTPEQRERWLPPIRRGEIHFSLGYSEPEAGSDLASLRTRAERRGDVYVVTGEKCWTSYAQDSDHLWLLCRTGSPESRGDGLTLLVVDLDAPGVTVSPLPTLDDEQLSEVRLEGVEVPVERRIGPEDGAWKLMGEALADERHIQFPPGRLHRDLEDVVARGARVRDARTAGGRRHAEGTLGCSGGGGEQGRSHRGLPAHRSRGPRPRWARGPAAQRGRRVPVAPEHVGDHRRRHLGNHARRGGAPGAAAGGASLSAAAQYGGTR